MTMGCIVSRTNVDVDNSFDCWPTKQDSTTQLDELRELSCNDLNSSVARRNSSKRRFSCHHTNSGSCQLCHILSIREEKRAASRTKNAFPKCGPQCKPCSIMSSGLCCQHADKWVAQTGGKLRIRFCSHCREQTGRPQEVQASLLKDPKVKCLPLNARPAPVFQVRSGKPNPKICLQRAMSTATSNSFADCYKPSVPATMFPLEMRDTSLWIDSRTMMQEATV